MAVQGCVMRPCSTTLITPSWPLSRLAAELAITFRRHTDGLKMLVLKHAWPGGYHSWMHRRRLDRNLSEVVETNDGELRISNYSWRPASKSPKEGAQALEHTPLRLSKAPFPSHYQWYAKPFDAVVFKGQAGLQRRDIPPASHTIVKSFILPPFCKPDSRPSQSASNKICYMWIRKSRRHSPDPLAQICPFYIDLIFPS